MARSEAFDIDEPSNWPLDGCGKFIFYRKFSYIFKYLSAAWPDSWHRISIDKSVQISAHIFNDCGRKLRQLLRTVNSALVENA